MRLMNLFIWLLSVPTCFLVANIYDITKDGYEQYQDIYLNGKVIRKASKYERHEDARYAILDSVLSKYERPFTMLDVGASQGYFTFRSAEKYPHSVFVMLEGSNPHYPKISKQLRSICNANKTCKNVIWFDRSINARDFKRMQQCEHFDVILAQNILHWFPNDWKSLLDSFTSMSHVTIIELPPAEKSLGTVQYRLRQRLHRHLKKQATHVLEGVPRHTNPKLKTVYYILENNNQSFLKTTSMIDHSVGEFYSVALTNGKMQADTGTKMIHVGKNTKSTIISKGISADESDNSYRGLVKVAPRAEKARNYTQCDSMLVGNACSANTFPYIEVANTTSQIEHEASTSKMSEEQLFYLQSRGISLEDAINMIVNGFCKDVFQELPLEFAAEAQKLLTLKLEGSVG